MILLAREINDEKWKCDCNGDVRGSALQITSIEPLSSMNNKGIPIVLLPSNL